MLVTPRHPPGAAPTERPEPLRSGALCCVRGSGVPAATGPP